MPPKSSVITSPYRKEIEEMLLEGKSPRQISKWLKEQDENISHTAINNYRNNHFNPSKEAGLEYQNIQSKKRKTRAKNRILSDLEFLDQVKDAAGNIKLVVDEDTKPIEIVKAGIQAVKEKNNILKAGEDKAPVEVNINLSEFNRLMDKGLEDIKDDEDVDNKPKKSKE